MARQIELEVTIATILNVLFTSHFKILGCQAIIKKN